MKTNPLYEFINEVKPTIAHPITYLESRNYLLIKRGAPDKSSDLFENYIREEGHLRIDQKAMFLDEPYNKSPYSTNLSPAHYTERYCENNGNERRVLHVYFNLKSDVLKVIVKNENTGEILPLSRTQETEIDQASSWAAKILQDLLKMRDEHLTSITEETDLKNCMQLIYNRLSTNQLAGIASKITPLLDTLKKSERYTFGYITPQTEFLERLTRSTQAQKPPPGKVSIFEALADNTAENEELDAPTEIDFIDSIPQTNPQEIATKQAEERKSIIELAFNDLAAKVIACNDDTLSFKEYHERHLAVILANCCVLDYRKNELSANQSKILKESDTLIKKYQPAQQQILTFALEGNIEKLNLAIDYAQGSPDAKILSIFVVIASNHFKNINDDNFAKLLKYILTCDKFTHLGFFASSLAVSIGNHIFNLKQLLLLLQYEKSFLTLTEHCPNTLLLSSTPEINAINLLASARAQLVIDYLDTRSATSTYGQDVEQHLDLMRQCTHKAKLNLSAILKSSPLGKNFNKKHRSVTQSAGATATINQFVREGNSILLKEIFDQGQLTSILDALDPEQDKAIDKLCEKYKSAAGNLDSFLHAVYVLSSYKNIVTRRMQSCSPGLSYHASDQESLTHLQSWGPILGQLGYPIHIPNIFTNFSWFLSEKNPELYLLMKLCNQLLEDQSEESLIKILKELEKSDQQEALCQFYGHYHILTAYQIATEQLQNKIINKVDNAETLMLHGTHLLTLISENPPQEPHAINLAGNSNLQALKEVLVKLQTPSKKLYEFTLRLRISPTEIIDHSPDNTKRFSQLQEQICDLKNPNSMTNNLKRFVNMTKRLDACISEQKLPQP